MISSLNVTSSPAPTEFDAEHRNVPAWEHCTPVSNSRDRYRCRKIGTDENTGCCRRSDSSRNNSWSPSRPTRYHRTTGAGLLSTRHDRVTSWPSSHCPTSASGSSFMKQDCTLGASGTDVPPSTTLDDDGKQGSIRGKQPAQLARPRLQIDMWGSRDLVKVT